MTAPTKLASWLAFSAARASVAVAIALSASLEVRAQVIAYEGTGFPEEVGWQRLDVGIERKSENGWFIHTLYLPDQDFYRYEIGGITSLVGRFFVEWRAVTNNPQWLIDEWQVPAVVAAGGRAGVLHHTVMTESAAVLLRDIFIPRVIAPISLSESHTYRVEVFSNEYIWYIDGVVVDNGVPEGPYPDPDAAVVWGAEVIHEDAATATTAWDFVRLGGIPDDASGDYDSDAAVTLIDHYFLVDCLTKDGPGIFGGPGEDAGPGCRFADFDADSDTDLLDFAEFQNGFGLQR